MTSATLSPNSPPTVLAPLRSKEKNRAIEDEAAAHELLALQKTNITLPSFPFHTLTSTSAPALVSSTQSPAISPTITAPPVVVPSMPVPVPVHQASHRRFSVAAVTLPSQSQQNAAPATSHQRRHSLAPSMIPAPALPPFALGGSGKRKSSMQDNSNQVVQALPPAKRRFSVAAMSLQHLHQQQPQQHVIHRLPQAYQMPQQQQPLQQPVQNHTRIHNPMFMTRQPAQYPQQLPVQQQRIFPQLSSEEERRASLASGASAEVESESEDADRGSGPLNSKESHKFAERARRTKMNELFDELKGLLPSNAFGDCKASKLDILAKAVEHMTQTNELLKEYKLM